MIPVVVMLAILAAVLFFTAGWAVKTANRLDRLHVRRDLAWQALVAALDRRALMARTLAASLGADGPVGARELAELAGALESSEGARREQLESQLSVLLAEVDADGLSPQFAVERADAAARVRFARSFYNEAVRDILALRTRSVVRLFRLAGKAELPRYFEIVETVGTLSSGAAD